MRLYDVHFTIKGNWQIFADSEEEAMQKANNIYEYDKQDLEHTLNTEITFDADDALFLEEEV